MTLASIIGVIGAVGVVITIMGALAGVVFRMGHHAARIEQLERWRESIRVDMHEISAKLGIVSEELRRLATVIEERTERRQEQRPDTRPEPWAPGGSRT